MSGRSAAQIELTTPLADVVGARRAAALAVLGLTNVGKLIAHLPSRHERQEAETTIDQLAIGQVVATRGEVISTRVMARGPKPRFEAVILDTTGRLDVVWFNGLYLRDVLHPGVEVRVQGTAKRRGSSVQMVNPSVQVMGAREEPARAARLRPVYPATEAASSKEIERCIREVLDQALPLIEDHLSAAYRKERELPSLADAYRMMHKPESEGEVKAGRRRLAYDELLLLQLGVHLKRAHLRSHLKAPALRWTEAVDRHIRERFPFPLTPAQDDVVKEIAKDLASGTPTNRLIQGDVGSGKTVVALYAMLMAVGVGQQAAIMAPTEILAEQHFESISRMLSGSKVRIALLTGETEEGDRRVILRRCASGELDILVGTHALITERVKFASLAVAVVDEQHRFGVHQRAMLRGKGTDGATTPHVLVMTATPIPRTLAITLFGDLDISTIAGLPPGRKPVKTRVVDGEKRAEVYAWLRERLDKGDQAYIVAPTIGDGRAEADELTRDEGEPRGGDRPAGEVRDVRSLVKELEEGPLQGKRLAALHGRLRHATRERIMERFRAGAVDALIATTVIEVGVDVPNATIMIVEHADRFGLAQLHQLRGRVGRGAKASFCVLIASDGELTEDGRRRLEVLAKTSDGFALAERDLELRGPGELFGLKQSGAPPFKVADLSRGLDLLKMARRDAAAWLERSPYLAGADEALVRKRLLKAHGQWLGLGDVG